MKKILAMVLLCATTACVNANDKDDFYDTILGDKPNTVVIKKTGRTKISATKSSSRTHSTENTGLRAVVTQVARQHGVPANIAHGIVMVESRYNCNAYNRSGASGIMQILPNTARSVGVSGSLRNCSNGLQAGMRYLKLALNKGGYGCSGASLYERGIYARPSCTHYGRRVMAFAQRA